MISNINNIDLMTTLKEESKIYMDIKTQSGSEYNYCEQNFKFRDKVFLDYNK